MKRLETGVVQVEGDWPGIFMRGDDVLISGHHLEAICGLMEKGLPVPPFEIGKLKSLAKFMQSCDARKNPEAQMITRAASGIEEAQ